MKLFDAFKSSKTLVMKTELIKEYSGNYNNKEYKIIVPIKRANKHTIIHFIDKTIYWEQIPRFPKLAGRQYGEKIPIYKFTGEIFLNTLYHKKFSIVCICFLIFYHFLFI